ncbi:hypothetical protein DPX16_13578 [Anabarilius grahami]|uniref:F-box domain-containing protein n=1 Tax=Anabarilius grahami TaxID=495550 RepID=A0A3N0YBR2_ANAGA|nr:hypothetical protein DPX16_13578 [Anabarilius grahami]
MHGCPKDHGILTLPASVLEDIFIDVVLQEGDKAILMLALVCTCFRDLVTWEAFRRRAHIFWLDTRVIGNVLHSASHQPTTYRPARIRLAAATRSCDLSVAATASQLKIEPSLNYFPLCPDDHFCK